LANPYSAEADWLWRIPVEQSLPVIAERKNYTSLLPSKMLKAF
jgi:hypothetical protein